MIRTKFKTDLTHIPSNWVFEYYCRLNVKLHGQTVVITSVFNPHERTPSMHIEYNGKNYMFKDYSSGNSGDGAALVMKLYNLTYTQAKIKINDDYEKQDVIVGEELVFEKVNKFTVVDHVKRKWNTLDTKFWPRFNIGSAILNKYNVIPLSQFTLSKDNKGVIETRVITGKYIYGYFKENGDMYLVYQPYNALFKFFRMSLYIQGSEQLKYDKPLLMITSSLKDTMALDSLNFNLESISSTSETTLLDKSLLSAYSLKYKGIMCLLDNDNAGKLAMKKYDEMYGITGIYLNMSKDLSDSIDEFGAIKTKQFLTPLIPKL